MLWLSLLLAWLGGEAKLLKSPPCVFHRVVPRVPSEFSRFYRSADALSAHGLLLLITAIVDIVPSEWDVFSLVLVSHQWEGDIPFYTLLLPLLLFLERIKKV